MHAYSMLAQKGVVTLHKQVNKKVDSSIRFMYDYTKTHTSR